VTVSASNETSSTEKFILRALVISLFLHVLVYSLWRTGQAQGWWQNLAMPRWMQLVSKAMMPPALIKPASELPSQSQLTFVEVDPALATPEPPKKPLFQGAKNTVAANREIKVLSEMPNLDGRQTEYLKTTENAKPTPQRAAPAPPPAPAPPQKVARQNAPQPSYAPGDLTAARPSDKPREGKGKSETEASEQTEPRPQPAEDRPRTVAEARARSGNYGQQSRVAGGVNHISPDVSLDVQGTPLGNYIARMVDAIGDRWHKLLENESTDRTGKVVLRFRLHSDGTVSDLTPLKNEVSDLLEAACERGIKDPAPFGKWPPEMRRDLANDHYDITFTFYYELY
jgi:outer membrane biosynthesis protein TonB